MTKRKAIIDDGFNPELVAGARFAGIFEMPCIEAPDTIIVPDGFTPWSQRKRAPTANELLEFFENDFGFAEVLIDPGSFTKSILEFPLFTPLDNSLYRDASLAVQIANIYRSRAIGSYYQREGANVYPLVRWGDERTYTTCVLPEKVAFAGVEKRGPVVVSSYGCYRSRQDRFHFEAGFMAMMDELEPSMVLVHGALSRSLADDVRGRTDLHQYPDWISRMKGRG